MAIHLGVVNKDFGELQQLDETINSSYLQERKVSIDIGLFNHALHLHYGFAP